MGISQEVCRSLGGEHDIVHLRSQGLHRLPDEAVLQKAAEERRILLTHDLDMGRLLASSGAGMPSLITFRLTDMRPASVMERLQDALRLFSSQLEAGAAVTVSDRTIRCHRLPIARQED